MKWTLWLMNYAVFLSVIHGTGLTLHQIGKREILFNTHTHTHCGTSLLRIYFKNTSSIGEKHIFNIC